MLTFSDLSMELLNEVLYFDIFDAITIFSAVISLLLSIVFNKSNLTTLSTLTYSIISIAVTLTHLGEPADDLYFGRLLFLILVIFLVFFTVSTDYYVEKKVLGEEAN